MNHRDTEFSDPQPGRMSAFPIVLLFVVGVAMGHCWWIGDHVALGTLFIFTIGSAIGYFSGLWRSIASSVGMFIGYQFAVPVSVQLIPLLEGQLNRRIEPAIGLTISGAVAGIVATIVLMLIGMILRRNPVFKRCDQYAGGVAGLATTVACVALVFWVLLASESKIQQSRQVAIQNQSMSTENDSKYVAINRLAEFIDATKKSYVMVGLRSWNPFLDVAYFRDLKSKIESSIDPAKQRTSSDNGLMGSITKLLRAPGAGQHRQALQPAFELDGSKDIGGAFQNLSAGAFGSFSQ